MNPQPTYSQAVIESAHQLMKEILPLKEQRFVDGAKFHSIVEQMHIDDIEQKIYFLRELHSIVRKLPMKIFSDDESRLRLVAAIQEALDSAVDQEEEELEGEFE